jgi:hypothetical protein
MSTIFEEIKQNNKNYTPQRSQQWFKTNVTNAFSGMGTQRFLGQNLTLQTKTIYPGGMFFFGYNPKFKSELPFYDNFPLVLPFSEDAKHFTGLNLHYMAPQYRMMILDKLLGISSNKMIPDNLKKNLSWQYLKRIAGQRVAEHAVKQYLKGYVMTSFVSVPTKDWSIAVHLPLARFVGASEQSVWRKM